MKYAPDLANYFATIQNGSYHGVFNSGVNLLNLDDAQKLTHELAQQPIIKYLDGLVLDDANTSNYHVYLQHPTCQGYVLFLSHDGDTGLVYSSLAEFLHAVDAAIEQGELLEFCHPKCAPIVQEQAALCALIEQLVAEEVDIEVVIVLIAALDLKNLRLLERLAAHDDFFVVEAVALEIQKRPSSALRPIADLCSRHRHLQAAKAGLIALRQIRLC